MTQTEREILTQPETWTSAAGLASQLALEDLPPNGARLAVIGCGTSLFMAQAFAALRESAGRGETDAFTPTQAPQGRQYDAVLAISRSGTTTEVVRYLENVSSSAETFGITAVSDSPVSRATDHAVVIEFADEISVVQTRFATSALALLRSYLGENLSGAIADAKEAVGRQTLGFDPASFGQFVFLGTGWASGLANEAALKMREAAGAWTESYPPSEYRHGPISAAGSQTLVWSLSAIEDDLASAISQTGATLVQGTLDPMAELILAQRAAIGLARARGLNPDTPRFLTRSVILPAELPDRRN